jgi:hypothetical protein
MVLSAGRVTLAGKRKGHRVLDRLLKGISEFGDSPSGGGIQVTLKNVVPMMTVPDVGEPITFYSKMRGFELINQMEGWALVRNGRKDVNPV